ncbi:hypothetical protein HID58_030161 [Brassica napus]|uniref:C-JID domain-containing protein n=1 Tax=Brassica napus TaxID=3708 RepID=A0ABQ8CH58_BRANA|nr:hypothetical protein HID58_030161 [Brassica napus]
MANLTDLNLSFSEIEELWEGVKDTPKLKWVDLSHSSKLCNLTGLLNAESLQRLNLEGCTSLEELPREMKRMKCLVFLNMRGCTSLRVLPHMNLISMKTLILTNCSSLQTFRVVSDNLETLHLDGSAIGQLPTNMWKLQRLIVLNLKDCKMLAELPECLGKLKALQELVLSGCSKLKTFPIRIENMKSLQLLLLDGTSITDMPKILQLNSSKVEDWPELRRAAGRSVRTLPLPPNLTSIPLLPPNLEILDAHGCDKLKTVMSPMAILKHMEKVHSKFIFTNCNSLEQASKDSITTYAQKKSQLDALRCYKEGHASEALFITSFPGSEVPSWFDHRMIGSTLKLKFPPHWCDNRLSTIVLCAVVAFQNEINSFSIECTCEFKNELGTCTRFSSILGGGWIEPRKIDSDHVFIGYTSSSHIINHVEGSPEHQKCVPTEASIKFKVIDGAGEIVNCGLSLVYEEPNHVVVEGDCSGTSSGRGLSVVESTMSFATRFLSVILSSNYVNGFRDLKERDGSESRSMSSTASSSVLEKNFYTNVSTVRFEHALVHENGNVDKSGNCKPRGGGGSGGGGVGGEGGKENPHKKKKGSCGGGGGGGGGGRGGGGGGGGGGDSGGGGGGGGGGGRGEGGGGGGGGRGGGGGGGGGGGRGGGGGGGGGRGAGGGGGGGGGSDGKGGGWGFGWGGDGPGQNGGYCWYPGCAKKVNGKS